MTATPAQIANDMAAHATYWKGRDRYVERTCEIAEVVIRRFLKGEQVDGRMFNGLHVRLLNLVSRRDADPVKGWPDFGRVQTVIFDLRAAARRTEV